MRCLSCPKDYATRDSGICKECYEDLKSKVAFLEFSSSLDSSSPTCFSDVVLVASHHASDQTDLAPPVPIHAHKAVLANRSPVFRAMFENQMEEGLSGTVKISDVSHDALRAFVNYLYTAEACLDDQMARDLLVMAEKYQVKHLKAYCEKFIASKLNRGSSLSSYAFAHQHNAKHLLDAALSLIVENMDKLTKLEEYRELKEKDPQLVLEIYEAHHAKQVKTAAPTKISSTPTQHSTSFSPFSSSPSFGPSSSSSSFGPFSSSPSLGPFSSRPSF
ncbi:BTB/POZ domain [Dillenia turbinata]|uniref:BTB/POZ domain n=1 Tax=Dillenia turbinata TaxID=194707 RepID=A0AAN8W1S5_9MAGN